MSCMNWQLGLLLAVASHIAFADPQPLYRWTDSEGSVHFTDQPPPATRKRPRRWWCPVTPHPHWHRPTTRIRFSTSRNAWRLHVKTWNVNAASAANVTASTRCVSVNWRPVSRRCAPHRPTARPFMPIRAPSIRVHPAARERDGRITVRPRRPCGRPNTRRIGRLARLCCARHPVLAWSQGADPAATAPRHASLRLPCLSRYMSSSAASNSAATFFPLCGYSAQPILTLSANALLLTRIGSANRPFRRRIS